MMLLRSDIILLLLTLRHAYGKLPPSGTLFASNRTVPHNSLRRGDARKYRGLQSGTCGGGSVGDGICPNGMCCSCWGWCGTTPEHCDNKCCGGGQVGNGICVDGSCCSQWGYCGTSPEYCQTEPPKGTPMPTSPPTSSEVPASLPPSASPTSPPAVVLDDVVVASAQLIVEIEPSTQDILDQLDGDPTNPELLDQLRDLSIRTWSSESGLQLAQTLEASDTTDETYVQLRESANAAVPLLCERVEAGEALFTQAAADCICGKTLHPSTYCAAVASREILDYIADDANRGGSSHHSRRHLGICKTSDPDDPNKPSSTLANLADIYDMITKGGSCLEATCEIPLPPPATFIQAALEVGGCIPSINLEEMTFCDEGSSCSPIEDLLQIGTTAVIDAATDPRFYIKAELCLAAIDDVPFIGDVILPALNFLQISSCFAGIDLAFWPLMGYLGFDAYANLPLVTVGVNVEAQFYDEVKDAFSVCGLLEGDQCSNQDDDSKRGQNSCSLCAGDDRGNFYVEIGFFLFKKKVDFPWGDAVDGECIASCSDRPGDLPDNPSVPNRLVVYATSWAQYRLPGTANLPDGSTVSRPDSCAARATKPADALASGATHINYAFAVLDPTSYAVITYEWNDADLMTSLNAGKGEVKTLISIGGWSFSQGETPTYGESSKTVFPTMAATQASRAAFISSAIEFATQYNFDGIDLDWEYPEEADRENFIALLAEMRAAIDEDGRGLLFTAALPAGIGSFQKIAIDRVASYLDFVNLMSYDFHGGSFEPEGPVFSQTPILDCSGLFNVGWDIQTAVTEYLNAGVPAEKLTLGLAAYGRTWTLAGSNADLGAPANGAGPAGSCTLEPGSLAYYEIMESIDVSGISYDKHTLSAFARYGDNGFVAFDDPQTISDKVCWARSLGLGGLMIWDADQDDSHTISKGVAASMGADFSQSCGGFTMPSCS